MCRRVHTADTRGMHTDTITFTAHLGTNDEGEITLHVNRAIPAGIDGPFTPIMPATGMDLDQIAEELGRHGYMLAGPWQTVAAYDGLRLEAAVMPR